MEKRRKSIPAKIKAELQKEVDSVCPFCESEEVGHFEVHHIDENPSNNIVENLLLVSPTCHSKITKGDIVSEVVNQRKFELSQRKLVQKQTTKKVNNFNAPIIGNAIVGDNNIVTIKNTTRSSKPKHNKYPEGCIGADVQKHNYISYLIDRYHEYKKWEVGKEKMNYSIFLSNLKKRFKIGKTSPRRAYKRSVIRRMEI